MQEITRHNTNEERLVWWNSSRIRLNKALALGGLLVIVFCALIFGFVFKPSDDIPPINIFFFLIASVVYLFYFAVINVLFILLEVIDRTFIKSENLELRNKLLLQFRSVTFGIPFLYPAFLLIMNYLH